MKIAGMEVPKELEEAARPLQRKSRRRLFKWSLYFAVVICLIVVFQSLITYAPAAGANPQRTLQMLTAGFSAACAMFSLQQFRRRDAAELRDFLRSHNYCECGYKAVPSPDGGVLSCPECGRCWRKPALSATGANNPL